MKAHIVYRDTELGPYETSVLADGTEWAVCERGAGDCIATIADTPHADRIAHLFAASPQMFNALLAALPHLPPGTQVHASVTAAIEAAAPF